MNIGLRFRNVLYRIAPALVHELDSLVETIKQTWRVEHNDNGTHGTITSLTATTAAISTLTADVFAATGQTSLMLRARAGTYTAADTTPSVLNVSYLRIANGGAVTITTFDDGVEGQVIVLNFADGNTTVDRTGSYLAGGANFTGSAEDILVLVKGPTFWHEISRSVNS